ncbi:hypothetical protein EMGBS6_12250 [Opitutia bacterium]|nr:hypothetical protein EMGBS6_12250 [Opitutae bacterium]
MLQVTPLTHPHEHQEIQRRYHRLRLGRYGPHRCHQRKQPGASHGDLLLRPLDSATLSAKHGGKIKAYDTVEALLADPEIHVVDITSYPSQHSAPKPSPPRKAKKHIILEKPMANSMPEVIQIFEAAEKNGVKGCVCFECRFSSQMEATRPSSTKASSARSITAKSTTTTRHRPVVWPVPLEHRQEGWWQMPSSPPVATHLDDPPDVHARRSRLGHEL